MEWNVKIGWFYKKKYKKSILVLLRLKWGKGNVYIALAIFGSIFNVIKPLNVQGISCRYNNNKTKVGQ